MIMTNDEMNKHLCEVGKSCYLECVAIGQKLKSQFSLANLEQAGEDYIEIDREHKSPCFQNLYDAIDAIYNKYSNQLDYLDGAYICEVILGDVCEIKGWVS